MPIISVALIRPCQDANDMLPYNYGDLVTKYYYLYFYTLIALSSKEQWLVSVNVSVEETIVVTVMSLLDIRSEPVLQWSFGTVIEATELISDGSVWHVTVSPCAADVVMAWTSVSPGRLGIKVTYSAFIGNTTSNFLLDLCQYISNCNKSQLLDVVLTNNHVLVLTSSGLMISSHIGFTMENSTNQILNWTILADIFGCAKLLDSSVHLQVQNKVDNNTAELMFDEYSFGNEHNITHIEIEPKSNVLFVLGKQILHSYDGGNNFNELHMLTEGKMVDQTIFDQHGHKYFMVTNSVSLLFGMIAITVMLTTFKSRGVHLVGGVHHLDRCLSSLMQEQTLKACVNRLITFHETYPSSVITIDFMGNVIVANLTSNQKTHKLNISEDIKSWSEPVSKVFVPVQTSQSSVVLYEYKNNVSQSTLGDNDIGRVMSYSGGGALIIQDVKPLTSHPYFVRAISGFIVEPFVTDTPHGSLKITGHDFHVRLEAASGWLTSDVGRCVILPFLESFLITAVNGRTVVIGVSPLKVNINRTVDNTEWTLLAMAGNPTWTIKEDNCRHDFSSEVGYSVKKLDINENITLTGKPSNFSRQHNMLNYQRHTKTASITLIKADQKQGMMSVRILSAFVMFCRVQGMMSVRILSDFVCFVVFRGMMSVRILSDFVMFCRVQGMMSVMILSDLVMFCRVQGMMSVRILSDFVMFCRVQGMMSVRILSDFVCFVVYRGMMSVRILSDFVMFCRVQGMMSVRILSDFVCLRCPKAAILYTVYLVCDCDKRLEYFNPKRLNMTEYLYGHPTDNTGSVLIQLSKNYRPPSEFGIDIPTTDNIYNVDPVQPQSSDRFKISQKTGKYKQCEGKSKRSECNCTPEMMYSDDVQFSDCKQRVYRTYYPGVIRAHFLIKHSASGQRFLVGQSETDLLRVVTNDSTRTWCTPRDIQIIMEVYVDQTFLPYPVPQVIEYSVAFLIGAILLAIYVVYTH
ncbi:hypothetical protein LSH36_59g05014 [Paralvinella palmiformis]|uniref:Uncharacterized protein n=1 Tax=Paralvinella palmiformis TaxID=53620 RepID=A0AAD9K4N1_9ANNE|nr:hypothetical protein LSH36_59g05014 [Paralvinella palmiformis]